MSKYFFENVDNIVDKEVSEYYFINKRKRQFWHSKSTTISCRVREKNDFNKAKEMALNIRAFLLNEEKFFLKKIVAVMRYINQKDAKEIRKFVYSRFSNISKNELKEKMGLIVGSLSEEEIKCALNLEHVVSCRLLGYEKELFFLKCYTWRILPAYVLRVLYHTRHSHLKLRKLFDEINLNKGIELEEYLVRIQFK